MSGVNGIEASATTSSPTTEALPSGKRTWLPFLWVTASIGVLVSLAEISRLSGSILDLEGRVWAFAELMGPSAWASRAGWQSTFQEDDLWRRLLRIYLGFDVLLIIGYSFALRYVIRRRASTGWRAKIAGTLVVLLVVADLIENGCALAFAGWSAADAWQAGVIAVITIIKGILALAATAVIAYALAPPWNDSAFEALRVVLAKHRYSFVPVLILGIVAVTPGADILDQVPDIERRWADGWENFIFEGGPALLALVLLAGQLFLIGRARAHQLARPDMKEHGRPALLWPWVAAPLVLLALPALVLGVAGAPVAPLRLAAACLVPLGVAGVSWLLRSKHTWFERNGVKVQQPSDQTWPHTNLDLLKWVGDGLALAVLALAALGAVRSLTAVTVLTPLTSEVTFNGRAVFIFVVGWIAVFALWPAVFLFYGLLLTATTPRQKVASAVKKVATISWLEPSLGESKPTMLRFFPRILLIVSLAIFAGLGLFPTVAGQAGVLFVFVLCLVSLTGIVAGVGLVTRNRQAAEAFQLMGQRSTPVLALLVAAVIFAGQVNPWLAVHAVRADLGEDLPAQTSLADNPGTDRRPDLASAVDQWVMAQSGCVITRTVTAGGTTHAVELMPMVIVAAEGGGVRAAYWTVQSVQQLAANECAKGSVLFSSGVSGGAVGLAAVRFNKNPTAVVTNMSNSRALSYGLLGLMVRDFMYSVTGIPLPVIFGESGMQWLDRAALMEEAWAASAEEVDGWAEKDFTTAEPYPTTGHVILNSMSVGNACRIWVSDLRLRPVDEDVGDENGTKIGCSQQDVPGNRSVDLISAYGADTAAVTKGQHPGCLYGMQVTTAAMLAARFPYVTPSGWVGDCRRGAPMSPNDQLVDGGYLENTGLGTVNVLSDVWLEKVQAWNAQQAALTTPRFIVPMIVYLDNDAGNDRRAPSRDITNEALIPPLAKLRAASGSIADEANRQAALDLVQPDRVCGLVADPERSVCHLTVRVVPRRVFLVYPASTPQIAAPLGWVLSSASRDSMDQAITTQAAAHCGPTATAASAVLCARGYGTLGDLLQQVNRGR